MNDSRFNSRPSSIVVFTLRAVDRVFQLNHHASYSFKAAISNFFDSKVMNRYNVDSNHSTYYDTFYKHVLPA